MPADSFAPQVNSSGTEAEAVSIATPELTAAALAQLSEGVIVTDAAGRIQFVNAAAARLHGVARLDVGVGEYAPTYHLLTEDGRAYPNIELPLARAVLRGETVLDARWRIRRPDGSEILAIGSARPVLSAGGELLGAVLTLRDDSARARAEAAERTAAVELRQLGGALQQQNALLQEQAMELELSNEQLQDQAAELETQRAELEMAASTLAERSDEADRARTAAEESARLFRTLADAIPTLAWTARADGYIDWYNARWYEYTGTTPAQMEGWGWQSVHDPVTLPRVLEEWTGSIASGTAFEMTFPLLGADGRFRPFLTRIIPVRDDSGAITRWFGTNTDVEATVAAAERSERLQALTAALAAAVSVDEVAEVVVAAAAAGASARTAALLLRVIGTNEALIVRQTGLHETVMAEFGRFGLDMPGPGAACLRTGDAMFIGQRDGPAGLLARFPEIPHVWEVLRTQAVATVPLAVAGEVIGAMSFTFDAPRAFLDDERAFFLALGRQAAQALDRARLLEAERSARAAAEAANRVKAEFLSTMSHELRTPLNAIGGYAELLQMGLRGPVTEAQTIDLGRIRSAGQHLQSLINDILNFARLEAGHVHFDPQDVAVSGALADVVTLMLPQLRERGLEQECEPAMPAGLAVRADPEKLRQILLNLLTNAVKFTASGGRITLECATDIVGGDARVLLRVTDTGRGIPADQLGRIFEPFVQVDRHLTGASQQGVGLGLAISRDLARAMGGDLTVESALGTGSTFTLSLPRA